MYNEKLKEKERNSIECNRIEANECYFILQGIKSMMTLEITQSRFAQPSSDFATAAAVYSCAGVPLFRRNGNRQSGRRKPLNRNRDTALNCLLPASLLA